MLPDFFLNKTKPAANFIICPHFRLIFLFDHRYALAVTIFQGGGA